MCRNWSISSFHLSKMTVWQLLKSHQDLRKYMKTLKRKPSLTLVDSVYNMGSLGQWKVCRKRTRKSNLNENKLSKSSVHCHFEPFVVVFEKVVLTVTQRFVWIITTKRFFSSTRRLFKKNKIKVFFKICLKIWVFYAWYSWIFV